jgi:cob(I)alamin adenosyltransferase
MVKLNKIYTRTGDNGTTGLVDGSRVSKSELRMHAIGDVDEANSALGLAILAVERFAILAVERFADLPDLVPRLRHIQNDLFDLGADIATPGDDFTPSPMALRIIQPQVDWLEAAIDNANDQLPPLNSFILPGGTEESSAMHLARAITRRAERSMVAASSVDSLNPLAIAYINRLSDYLFVLCRVLNKRQGGDILWVPGGSR